jgi:hypothetical protein
MKKPLCSMCLLLLGCTEVRELARLSDADAQSAARLAACEGLSTTTAAVWADLYSAATDVVVLDPRLDWTPQQQQTAAVNLVRQSYVDAYCEGSDTAMPQVSSVDYCRLGQHRVTAECIGPAAPLLRCVTALEVTDARVACADVWLGTDCDPLKPYEAVPLPVGGLIDTCAGGDVAWVGEYVGNVYSYGLPEPGATDSCTDGHTYAASCAVQSDCTMQCDCILDLTKLNTTTATEVNYGDPRFAAMLACGWIL